MYGGAHIMHQPGGHVGVGALLGLALGMRTALGILVWVFFFSVFIAEYPDA